MVLKGARPIPEDHVPAWVAVLGIPADSPSAQEFTRAAQEHRVYTATGQAGQMGEALVREVRSLKAENRDLKARLARLERRASP